MNDRRVLRLKEDLAALHQRINTELGALETDVRFETEAWTRAESSGTTRGSGMTSVLEGGAVFERAATALMDLKGPVLPEEFAPSFPESAQQPFRAIALCVAVHPQNPYVPATELNLRLIATEHQFAFSGGCDLLPAIPYLADAVAWHQTLASACAPFGAAIYPELKRRCDERFFSRRRGESRGVGGLAFDNLNADTPHIGLPYDQCASLLMSIGSKFLQVYAPIVAARARAPFGERERAFQLFRRGRQVELELVSKDAGFFTAQVGRKTDSVSLSMPPLASWSSKGTDPELKAQLAPFLEPQPWVLGPPPALETPRAHALRA